MIKFGINLWETVSCSYSFTERLVYVMVIFDSKRI